MVELMGFELDLMLGFSQVHLPDKLLELQLVMVLEYVLVLLSEQWKELTWVVQQV